MQMKDEIYLIGGGGHCKSCIDVIEQENRFFIKGIIDVKEKLGDKLFEYNYIGTDSDIENIAKSNPFFFLTVGHIKDCSIRKKIFFSISKLNLTFPTIFSPKAAVSKHAYIDQGTIIMHNAVVNAGAKVGKNCIINTGAIIEHDAEIGNCCHISTGVIINGGTRITDDTFIGSNSVCKENITIKNTRFVPCHSRIISNI
ncbi:acetyl transferase [Candidatus Magnetomorum sp. HK-1]|nr:acetyl transferase [Candidatus Magnetomorum sp. HK-1]